MRALICTLLLVVPAMTNVSAQTAEQTDREEVARLDKLFQAAVKRNDAASMDKILHKNMVLILGDGRINTREEQLDEARNKAIQYEVQDEDPDTQTVRLAGDTAVVTARLWVKGTIDRRAFDRHLWFSDVYVRTPEGWRYFIGQASLHLP